MAGVGTTSPWASTSWLPTSGYHGARRPAARNGFCAASRAPGGRGAALSVQRAGGGWGVVAGPVVERAGRVGRLHAVVAAAAGVRVGLPAVQRVDRLAE